MLTTLMSISAIVFGSLVSTGIALAQSPGVTSWLVAPPVSVSSPKQRAPSGSLASAPVASVTVTLCPPLILTGPLNTVVPAAPLSSGNWQVTVTVNSFSLAASTAAASPFSSLVTLTFPAE